MFTGIIKEVGKLNNIKKTSRGFEIEVLSSLLTKDMKTGDSIAVNGCCLTVNNFTAGKSFKADISPATLKATSFRFLKQGSYLNLEDAMKPCDKLGGHIVSGHVDNIGTINAILKEGEFYKISLKISEDLLLFAAPKGSISVDGISLTIAEAANDTISFAIIPFTFNNTNLKFKKAGEKVNLEADLLARYILNMIKHENINSNITNNSVGNINQQKGNGLLNFLKIYNMSDNLKNEKNNDMILEEKLKKYGFKK